MTNIKIAGTTCIIIICNSYCSSQNSRLPHMILYFVSSWGQRSHVFAVLYFLDEMRNLLL